MSWTIMGALLMIILLLTSKNILSGKKEEFILSEPQEFEEMKRHTKENLESSNDILTIKAIRKKYGLSLVDAKKVMDVAKVN